jgi:hypothetical protein
MNSIQKLVDSFTFEIEEAGFPGFPGNFPGSENPQVSDEVSFSRSSRISRSETQHHCKQDELGSGAAIEKPGDRAREGALFKTPGNPGNPGKDGLGDCSSSSFHFPVEEEEPGNAGKSGASPASAPEPLPIPPVEVRALFDRTLADLKRHCPHDQHLVPRAIAVVTSKLHNDPRLSPIQTNSNHCWICGKPEGVVGFIAVLSAGAGKHYWMHSDCHAEHRVRVQQKVAACLREANIESACLDTQSSKLS